MTYHKPSKGIVFAAFENMRIDHPRLPGVHETLSDVREAGRLTPLSPKRFIEFFAPSHSGKSMAIKTYIENVVVDEVIAKGLFPSDMDRAEIAKQQRLVVHVTLSPEASVRSMSADILHQLGDPRADVGTGPVLMRRVYEYLNGTYKDPATGKEIGRQTELLIIDELQQLNASKARNIKGKTFKSNELKSTAVTDTLKTMLIRGLVPMVFVGVEKARDLIAIDRQIMNRSMGKIDFSPLRWSSATDQSIFLEYCGELALRMTEFELLPEETDLLDVEIAQRLWVVSGGCIGVVSRVVEQAVLLALKRDARKVEYQDLSLAVDTYAIPEEMCTYNPFREGIRKSDLGEAA